MKALRLHDAKVLRVDDVDEPKISDDEVLIRVRYAGICGTDLHAYKGALRDRVKYPAILGHEFSGVVARVGSKVTWVSEGDEVVANPVVPCGRCVACINGRPNVCVNFKILGVDIPGVFAEYVKVPGRNVHRIPKGISLRTAALVEPYTVAVHSCRRANIEAGDVVVIIGQGPIGLCTLQVAKHYGAYKVITLEVLESRLKLSKELGADAVINPAKTDPVKEVRELTEGLGADKVIETSGNPAALNQAIEMLKPAGRVVVVGLSFEESRIRTTPIVYKEAEIVGSRVYVGEFPRTLNLLSAGYLNPEPLITHEMSLEEGPKAFHILEERREEAIKVLLKP